MMARSRLVAALVALAVVSLAAGVEAASKKKGSGAVKAHRGGYSYSPEDTINTYGDSRSKYGGASSLRDPMLDRQTEAGPFDHGFFFDSGVAPRGGDSPYMN
jgi:hypothetical protein